MHWEERKQLFSFNAQSTMTVTSEPKGPRTLWWFCTTSIISIWLCKPKSLLWKYVYVCVCVWGGGGGVREWVKDRKIELLQGTCATEAPFIKSDRTISPDAQKARLFVFATLTFLSWPVLATLVSRFRTAINMSLYKQAHFKCLLFWLRRKSNESALSISTWLLKQ